MEYNNYQQQPQLTHIITVYTYQEKKYLPGYDLINNGFGLEVYKSSDDYYEVSDNNLEELKEENQKKGKNIEFEYKPMKSQQIELRADPKDRGMYPFPTEFGRKFTNRYQKNNSNGWIITGTYQIPTEKQTSPTTEELINMINNMKSVEELKNFKNMVYMIHDAAEKQLSLPEYSIEEIINMKGKDFIIRKPSPLEEKQFNKDSTFRKQSSSEQELFEKIKNLSIEELNTLIDTIFNIENPKSTHTRR